MLYKMSKQEALNNHLVIIDESSFNTSIRLKEYLKKSTLDNIRLKNILNKNYKNYMNDSLESIPSDELYNIISTIVNEQKTTNIIYIDNNLLTNLKLRDDLVVLTDDNSLALFDYKLYKNVNKLKKNYFNYPNILLLTIMLLLSLIFMSLYLTKPANKVRNDFINKYYSNPINVKENVSYINDLGPVVEFKETVKLPLAGYLHNLIITDYMKTYNDESISGDAKLVELKDGYLYTDKYNNAHLDYFLNAEYINGFRNDYNVYNALGDKISIMSVVDAKEKFNTDILYFSKSISTSNIYLNNETFKKLSYIYINKMNVLINDKEYDIICADDLLLTIFNLYDEKSISFKNKNLELSKPMFYDKYAISPGIYQTPITDDKYIVFTNDESLKLTENNLVHVNGLTTSLKVDDYGYIDIFSNQENKTNEIYVNSSLYKELFNNLNYQEKYLKENVTSYYIKPNSHIEDYLEEIKTYSMPSISEATMVEFKENINNANMLQYLYLTLFLVSILGLVLVEVLDDKRVYDLNIKVKNYGIITFKYHFILKYLLLASIFIIFLIFL